MNRLSTERRGQIIACLVEGMSIRGTVRVTGAAKNTVSKLLVDVGQACAEYQDKVLRDLRLTTIQCDEIWSFCYSKQKNIPDEFQDTPGYGDVWTWVAIDSDSKLVPSWLVGERTLRDAYTFIHDLGSRLKGHFQLTTDGLNLYLNTVDAVLGERVDYAILHKLYGEGGDDQHRYSPARCIGVDGRPVIGTPDPEKISTSYVERQNLTMRMGMRRFTRLTNGFSKKIENLAHAVSLHYLYHNFARPHGSLGKGTTPAMAADIETHPWTVWDIAQLGE